MANPNRVTGRARITIDGDAQPVAGSVTLDLGGITREEVNGDYQVGGFRESTKAAKLEFSVLSRSSFSASAFAAIDNSTVMVEFDTGQTYVIRQAWSEGPPQMATDDGKAKCVLCGQPAEELR